MTDNFEVAEDIKRNVSIKSSLQRDIYTKIKKNHGHFLLFRGGLTPK